MKYEFDCEIKMLEGKIKWNVFYFPFSVKDIFNTNGKLAVHISVDGHEFEHTLLPSRNGHYLVYNEFIRRAAKKKLGDSVHVILERSEEKREAVVPDYITEILKSNLVFDTFQKQPDYMKREQMNFIELAKMEETKNNRLMKLIERLRNTVDGN